MKKINQKVEKKSWKKPSMQEMTAKLTLLNPGTGSDALSGES